MVSRYVKTFRISLGDTELEISTFRDDSATPTIRINCGREDLEIPVRNPTDREQVIRLLSEVQESLKKDFIMF